MPITRAVLSQVERENLLKHVAKHKIYPFQYRFNKQMVVGNFPNVDPGGSNPGHYFTLQFTPSEITPVISLATAFIVTPNTVVGMFSIALSYKSTFTWGDNATPTVPDDEGNVIYHLLANGGSVNDFQVFYPTDWYVERAKPLYIHVWVADANFGQGFITGSVILGTLPTGG